MLLHLLRAWPGESCTIGELSVNGDFECFTLEDVVRDGPKVPGKTAIPAGEYPVTITFSQRFQRELPMLHDVPNFTGVRIHAGNTDKDTEGCILVGRARQQASISESRLALKPLQEKIQAALDAGDEVRIVIENREA